MVYLSNFPEDTQTAEPEEDLIQRTEDNEDYFYERM